MKPMPWLQQELRQWLPNYLNGHLGRPQRWLVQIWLRWSSDGRAHLATHRAVRRAARRQPIADPDPELLSQIRARVLARTQPRPVPTSAKRPVLARRFFVFVELLLVLLAVALIWQALPPGNVLQWTHNAPAETFRVYRAPISEAQDNYVLVREIPADPQDESYQILDLQLTPGQDYIYRIEAVQPSGFLAVSDPIVASAGSTLARQLLAVLTLILVALLLYASLRPAQEHHPYHAFNGA
ncbi:MAG: hypothetical protein R3300_20645 [Candidatus Promineifilaceae bacterium]|nr:hypothetical protein [Candidatus Promineifilaceae bacterium]